MKGCGGMMRLSNNQQIEKLAELIKEDMDRLEKLPEKEAKKVAFDNLYSWGIIDADGKYTEPYVVLKERYVQ